MVKFTKRFEKLKGVKKAIYLPNKLHLTIFYDEKYSSEDIKRRVISELRKSNLEKSVETLSFYEE